MTQDSRSKWRLTWADWVVVAIIVLILLGAIVSTLDVLL